MNTQQILEGLGLEAVNPGAWSGDGGWLVDESMPLIDSLNPATGEILARVRAAGPADHERVMASAVAAFREWRLVPAPRRGEAVRRIGEARLHVRSVGQAGRRSVFARRSHVWQHRLGNATGVGRGDQRIFSGSTGRIAFRVAECLRCAGRQHLGQRHHQ